MSIGMLLSGGVDSSVALALLRKRGFEDLTAFYLKIWLEDEARFLGDCPWEEDLEYARSVCTRLRVPLEVVSLQREYYERVVSYAIAELKAGRTPSPDIFCNSRIKFGLFAERIGDSLDRIASGHYAVVRRVGGKSLLVRSPDPVKDQTYFLSRQSELQVRRSLFPIGHLEKSSVRELSVRHGLPTSERPDSQGVCFLGKIRYPDFVRHYLGEREGKIVDAVSGRILGSHRGYWFHTIGQRQGLGLSGGPWYVTGKSVVDNVIFVGHQSDGDARKSNRVVVVDAHWINGEPRPAEATGSTRTEIDPASPSARGDYSKTSRPPRGDGIPSRNASTEANHKTAGGDSLLDGLTVKLRHGPEMRNCSVEPLGDRRYEVLLKVPDNGVAPGQFTVFYRDDVCLGSARIESASLTSD